MPIAVSNELARTRHNIVRYWDAEKLVVLTRLPLPYVDFAEMEQQFLELQRAIATIARRHSVLLIDLRSGPARNDPAFEEKVAHHRQKLLRAFKKTAIIVQSAAGVLQLKRIAKSDGIEGVRIFAAPEEALAYLDVRMPPDILG